MPIVLVLFIISICTIFIVASIPILRNKPILSIPVTIAILLALAAIAATAASSNDRSKEAEVEVISSSGIQIFVYDSTVFNLTAMTSRIWEGDKLNIIIEDRYCRGVDWMNYVLVSVEEDGHTYVYNSCK